MSPGIGQRYVVGFPLLKLDPNATATTTIPPHERERFVHRLVVDVRPIVPYCQASRAYWAETLRGRRRRPPSKPRPWSVADAPPIVMSIIFGETSQTLMAVDARLFAPSSVGVTSFGRIRPGWRCRVEFRNVSALPMAVAAALIVTDL